MSVGGLLNDISASLAIPIERADLGDARIAQARLVAIAPLLAAATIAMNSSMTYLGGSIGATIGASAWTMLGERAAERVRRPAEESG